MACTVCINNNSHNTPGIKQSESNEEEGDDELLSPGESTMYRGLVARGNYLTQDRSDIQYAVKEVSRGMSKPKRRDFRRLKRLGKYLIANKRMVHHYEYQEGVKNLTTWTDSDHAGCKVTRKSTSAGVVPASITHSPPNTLDLNKKCTVTYSVELYAIEETNPLQFAIDRARLKIEAEE